jgi:hypothetical protein
MYAEAGGEVPQRYRPGWTRSMRGERDSGRKFSVLDRVMFASVLICLLVSAVWFFTAAKSPLPGA